MTKQVLFTSKDIENITLWFEERYKAHSGNIPDNEKETYLKLAQYWVLEAKGSS